MIEKLGGRKAATMVACLLAGIGCVALKGDIPNNFLMLLQTVFGGFVVGNGIEHVANARKKGEQVINQVGEAVSSETLEYLSSVSERLQSTESKLDVITDAVTGGNEALNYLVNYVNSQQQMINDMKAKAQNLRQKINE